MSRYRVLALFAAAMLIADPAAAYLYFRLTCPAVEAKLLKFEDSSSNRPMDAALVFCEGVGPRRGLSETTKLRLEFAAGLKRKGLVKHVAGIGGNWGRLRGDEAMRALLRDAGVPPEHAHGEPHSYDTLTNVEAVRKMLREKQWRRAVIISSPIHLHRILYLLKENHPDLRARIRVLPYSPHRGIVRVLDHWREIHHEWIARGMLLVLPRTWFRKLMRARRK